MLSILSTNLCHQPANLQQSPAILYLKLKNKPCCPMARPDSRDIGLDEGDIKPKDKSILDQAIEKISTRSSKDLFCDDILISYRSEERLTVRVGRVRMCILVIRTQYRKKLQNIAVLPFSKQDSILAETAGTITGWVAGISLVRVGKVAAFGIGGSVILLHVASECGYITVNWERVRAACMRSQHYIDCIIRFVKRNSCYSVGFIGGFFFGVASS